MRMARSIHKKQRGGPVASSIEKVRSVGGNKEYTACWPFKFGRQRRAKEDGNNTPKRKTHPIQPPGYPSGKRLKDR